ncbi:MAG: cadherin repeat domain-containing protein [Planctomycetes bacterium]|nr:cadherin repeat domain-containing protein [Planctomycetota bacterium]
MLLGEWLRALSNGASGTGFRRGRRPRRRRRPYYRGRIETLENRTLLSEVVNSPPVFNPDTYTFQVQENTTGAVIGTVSVSDPDGDYVNLIVYDGDTPLGNFLIDDNGTITGPHIVAFDYEAQQTHTLIIQGDDGVSFDEATVTIQITDQDDVPQFTQDPFTFDIGESAAVGTVVGTLTATDPLNTGLTYSVYSGDASDFDVSVDGVITVKNPLNYLLQSQYTFTVDVDNGLHLDNATVIINVIEEYQPPQFDSDSYYFTASENTGAGVYIGTVTATSPQNGTITYVISSSDGPFEIRDNGDIYTTAALEPGMTYILTVVADDGFRTNSVDVQIDVAWGPEW